MSQWIKFPYPPNLSELSVALALLCHFRSVLSRTARFCFFCSSVSFSNFLGNRLEKVLAICGVLDFGFCFKTGNRHSESRLGWLCWKVRISPDTIKVNGDSLSFRGKAEVTPSKFTINSSPRKRKSSSDLNRPSWDWTRRKTFGTRRAEEFWWL